MGKSAKSKAKSGTPADERVPAQIAEALKTDLGRLDSIAAGMGERAVQFVSTGTPEAVLLEIANHQQAVAQAMAQGWGGMYYAGSDTEAVQEARKTVLLAAGSLPVAVLHRIGRIVGAANPNIGVVRRSAGDDDGANWLRWLVLSTSHHMGGAWNRPSAQLYEIWGIARLAQCLAETGAAPSVLVHMLYGPKDYFWDNFAHAAPGLKDWLSANEALVAGVAEGLDSAGRTRLIDDLGRLDLATGLYQDLVFKVAVGSAKGPATAARTALSRLSFDVLAVQAKRAFEAKESGTRRGAAEVLAQLGGPAAKPLLAAQLAAETAKPMQDALAALIAQVEAISTPTTLADSGSTDSGTRLPAIDGSLIVIPPMPPPPADTKLPASVLEPLRAAAEAYNAVAEQRNREGQAAKHLAAQQGKPHWFHPSPLISEAGLAQALADVNGAPTTDHRPYAILFNPQYTGVDEAQVRRFFAHPEFTLWHALRLSLGTWRSLIMMLDHPHGLAELKLAEIVKRDGIDYRTLFEMQRAIEPIIPPDHDLRMLLRRHFGQSGEDEIPESLQHYIHEHPEVFEEAFGVRPRSTQEGVDDLAAVRMLARLSKVPERLLQPLLNMALSSRKVLRGVAREVLAPAKGIDEAIIARLVDPKKEVRATAADWLADRAPKQAADVLKKALKKEKAELPRAAMLSALARLGEDISGYFDEKALRKEAEAGLAKNAGKSLDWFPWPALPTLRWQGGKSVPSDVVRWWIVLADKLKDPQGNALFELYLDRCQPADAGKLGMFVLKAFIERDTVSPSDAEANAFAEQMTNQHMQWMAQYSQTNPNYPEPDRDQIFRSFRNGKLAEHLYSAADNKGILGLAVRAPGSEAAALVKAYAKEHGKKVSQTKSLIACLSRNPAPAALQVVLGVSNRIKQKSVQAYAGELVADAADRRGWSPDELADRTIPSAGLDEDGEFALDCGEDRTFKAVYRGGGKLDLLNPQGKPVKALPGPRGDAEKEIVVIAKKLLANAKKELKQTETAQQERLYEAMCVGRAWPLELWTSCLLKHPIAGRLIQRLVWQGLDADGKVLATFRVLEDGSLTDTDDDTVESAAFHGLRLAHRALIGEGQATAWVQHMKDYEVAPLFPQLDRPLHKLDDNQKAATAIDDRKGWMIESLKLKSIATKLGYQTGEVGDGGSYMDYVKRFNGAGVIVSVGFTGSYMGAGAERIAAALTDLEFRKVGARGRTLELSNVPPVLMSEAIADLHAMAAAGTGFDADWQKKSHF